MSGYIDPITGVMGLNDTQVIELLSGKRLEDIAHSDSLLRTFLHEATHHASLIGDVGIAYSALLAGIDAASLTSLINSTKCTPTALDLQTRDWLLLQLCQKYYVPLLEGLALYAEYDLYSCVVDVESGPLMHAKNIYLGKAFKTSFTETSKRMRPVKNAEESKALLADLAEAREQHFNRHMRAQRLTDSAIMRKKQLLETPLDRANPWSHYLLGYLAIKGLYARRPANSIIRKSTLFHLGAQARIFRDSMVALSLVAINDLDVNKVQITCASLINHLQESLDDFTINNRAVLTEIQEIISPSKEVDDKFRLQCLIRMGKDAHPAAPKFLAFRHILRYAAMPVQLEHLGHMAFIKSTDGQLLGSCPRVSNADYALVGTVEIAATPDGSDVALVVVTTDGLVAAKCLDSGEWNRPKHIALFDEMPSADLAHARSRKRMAGLLPANTPTGPVADALIAAASQLDKFGENALLNLAFPLESSLRLRAYATLTDKGFAGIFPPNELTELAKYSLIFSGEGLSITEGATLEERSTESCAKRIASFNATAQKAIGIPLFEVDATQVATSLV